jgi:hypothetical protein
MSYPNEAAHQRKRAQFRVIAPGSGPVYDFLTTMTHTLSESIRPELRSYLLIFGTVVFATAAVARWAHAEPKITCPDPAMGETQSDCPWAGVARLLIAKADAGQDKQVGKTLKTLLPDLDRALRSDSRREAWKNLWGRSINFDELANGVIVHPAILQALDDRFKSHAPMMLDNVRADSIKGFDSAKLIGSPEATDPAGHQLAHAGLEHTYGYLFSVLKTSFGYKRARWVEGEIEKGFGFANGVFGPRPGSGTLFSNITYFTGQIAFRGEEKKIAVLRKSGENLPAELRNFDYGKASVARLEETVEGKDSSGAIRKVILRTDLVAFPHPQKNTHLLVYSAEDPSNGGHVLITAFPVAGSFVDTVLNPDNLGEGKPVQTRYNAYVEGITGMKLTGLRKKAAQ